MICPLITMRNASRRGTGAMELPCLEGECAWWDSAEETCSIVVIAGELRTLGGVIRESAESRGELPPG